MKAYISELVAQAIHNISPAEAEAVLGSGVFDVSYPKSGFGDYACNAAMVLFKKFNVAPAGNPAEFATNLAAEIQKLDHKNTFAKVDSVGGFINFTLNDAYLVSRLQEVLELKENFGRSDFGSGNKVLLEYFQPNIAKPLHLGHLENGIFGDALFRILQYTGFNVESDTHLGDWGTQFGLLLLAYKKWGDDSVIATDPITELNKLYVRINTEMENDADLREQGKQEFVKLEQGDAENTKLWEQFKNWSWQEFDLMYSQVGIRKSDHDWPESFYADKMPQAIEMLREKGLLKESQGAQIVDLENWNLGVGIIVKSDGGTTYLLRDLATYIYRKQQGFEKQLYVVDVRQSHTLNQTFKILELLGVINSPDEAVHIHYGFLKLPDGAMSTRKGSIVGAKELIEDAQDHALQIIEEKNPGLTNKEQVKLQVANAAIKYFLLSRNLKDDIIYEQNKALSFEGNTGPYLQYAHARIHGIARKGDADGGSGAELNATVISTGNEADKNLLRKINLFSEIVERTSREYTPNTLCTYLFELAQNFNTFYEASPVLQAESTDLKQIRLQLCKATAQILRNGLNLLGIAAPEEM